ncbi:cytochrome P450 2C15-like [Haliotis rubra]|uniref:cytochrome P450 2C15-like n=1 Tax=Haliotis rubra TaxID=36100 RepID=UPI001EE57248|nr:cytochrome P450 2C15-like [Haliotis rubra]XP_046550256.1 cytochrome P450 2C15-like [Haliotis rubra]XP_046550257.1 cytochrome P450 2C15-like [Haliotis rubra]
MLTEIILGAAVVLFIAYIYQWKRKYSKMPPGPKPLPVLGNFQEIKDSTMLNDLTRLGSQYDGIFTVHLLMEPVLILDQFHIIRDLLLSPAYADIFSGRVNSYISKYLLPDDLLFQTASDTQQYLRKLTFRGIKQYGTALKNVEHLAQTEIQEMINRCRERNGVSFDPWNDLNQYVSNVILVLLCGRKFQLGHKTLENCQKISDAYDVLLHHKNQFLIDNVPFSTTLIPQLRHACQFLKDGYHYFTETFDKISQESKDTTPNCLYTLLLQEHEEGLISTENIKGVMVDSLLAGVITTKPTMYNALAAMVNFPEVQKKIQEEIQRVVGKDRLPGLEDRNKMPYSKAVELELYRYYTPIGTPGPRNTTQDCSFKGYSIPKGTRVIYNVWRVHHDESFWENPFTFDPTRFLDDNGELLPSEDEKRQRLLTFGVGKRSCIGEKLARVRIFLGLTSILQNFDLVRDPSEPFPSSDPSTYEPKFILQPPPYRLQFKP